MNPTWTPSATQRLERFLAETKQREARPGVDAEEVVADLRRHIEEELASAGLAVVTEAELIPLLARLAPPAQESPVQTDLISPNRAGPEINGTHRKAGQAVSRASIAVLMVAVVIPLIALVFEGTLNWCEQEYFDPWPTGMHVLLAFCVPLANGIVWLRLQQGSNSLPSWLWHANSVATGATAYFSLIFAPMLPLAVVGIIFFGLGLLPLAPLLGLTGALLLRRQLKAVYTTLGTPVPKGWAWGFSLPLLTLFVPLAFAIATQRLAVTASSPDASTAREALRSLRRWGNSDQLLLASYGRSWSPLESLFGRRVDQNQARLLYFQVTGKPFNAVKPPLSLASRRNRFALEEWALDGADRDGALGGESVAGRVLGLSLSGSRLDGILGADEATAYLEWTLEFRNDHDGAAREARAQIQLPPGGVVSRLTLWVNGEEREAAFAGRGSVREAYQQVAVAEGRDPVLVNAIGPDRILVQCFPVPPRGGTLKVRIGITAPLVLERLEEAILAWPVMVERNFSVPDSLRHSVWMEASQPLTSPSSKLHPDRTKPTRPGLRGLLSDVELTDPESHIRIRRNPAISHAWSVDTQMPSAGIAWQRVVDVAVAVPPRIAVVLDGSKTVMGELREIQRVLSEWTPQSEVSVYVASDEVQAQTITQFVRTPFQGVGGQDNVPALLEAWDWAAGKPGSLVLWIHGPQPVLIQSGDALRQRVEWRSEPGAPTLLDLQTRIGPNRIAERLEGVTHWRPVTRLGSLEDDVKRLLQLWNAPHTEHRLHRERRSNKPDSSEIGIKQGSTHLVRLLALEEIQLRWRERKIEEAVALGGMYQLVTPATGAVVLETKRQYDQTGLKPSHPATVPVVPEPQTVCLLVVGILVWMTFGRRR